MISVTERVPLGEVADWACGADIVTMPSIDDGMANGLLEGMALGLCPVVTEIFSDVVSDGVNGRVVPSSDHTLLTQVLQELEGDATLRESLGRAALEAMSKRDPSTEAGEYISLFKEVMVRK